MSIFTLELISLEEESIRKSRFLSLCLLQQQLELCETEIIKKENEIKNYKIELEKTEIELKKLQKAKKVQKEERENAEIVLEKTRHKYVADEEV
jgi:hypothetical protein